MLPNDLKPIMYAWKRSTFSKQQEDYAFSFSRVQRRVNKSSRYSDNHFTDTDRIECCAFQGYQIEDTIPAEAHGLVGDQSHMGEMTTEDLDSVSGKAV